MVVLRQISNTQMLDKSSLSVKCKIQALSEPSLIRNRLDIQEHALCTSGKHHRNKLNTIDVSTKVFQKCFQPLNYTFSKTHLLNSIKVKIRNKIRKQEFINIQCLC